MNIGFFNRPKVHTLLTTLYCAGIVASLCALYLLAYRFSPMALQQTFALVAVTFFLGILSIYLTARSKKQTVVYLEKKKDNASANQGDHQVQSQLDKMPIEKIMQAGEEVAQKVLTELCQQLQAGQGAIYLVDGNQNLTMKHGYALSFEKNTRPTYALGEGLIGRVAVEGKTLYIDKLPAGYITVFSGLGASSPSHLLIVPIKKEDETRGVIEIATFSILHNQTIRDLEILGTKLGNAIV